MSHARKAFTSNDYYNAYFWESPNPTAHVGSDSVFIDINPSFAGMLGYGPHEMMGRRWQEFTHPEDVNSDEKGIELVLSGDIPEYTMTKRYRHKDGRYVIARLTVMKITNGEETFEHFVSFAKEAPPLTGLKETLEDGQIKLRPSITVWQFVKDNPSQMTWLVVVLLVLATLGGHLGTVLSILDKTIQ